MRSWHWYSKVLFALVLPGLFICFVWPTPWKVTVRYGEDTTTLVRTNRITGIEQVWTHGHWAYPLVWEVEETSRREPEPSDNAQAAPRVQREVPLRATPVDVSHSQPGTVSARVNQYADELEAWARAANARDEEARVSSLAAEWDAYARDIAAYDKAHPEQAAEQKGHWVDPQKQRPTRPSSP